METDMHLALFDLDNTLLPIDSDYEWSRFLARLGVLDGDDYERENNRFYEQYKAGSLDIAEFLQFQLAPLAAHPRDTLDRWHARFMAEVVMPTITDQARELVDRHRERGDLIALVTATNAFWWRPRSRKQTGSSPAVRRARLRFARARSFVPTSGWARSASALTASSAAGSTAIRAMTSPCSSR
jgi:phosphoserine phosphatase